MINKQQETIPATAGFARPCRIASLCKDVQSSAGDTEAPDKRARPIGTHDMRCKW